MILNLLIFFFCFNYNVFIDRFLFVELYGEFVGFIDIFGI